MYELHSAKIGLAPLTPGTFPQLQASLDEEFIIDSLKYDAPFDFSYSCRALEERLIQPDFQRANPLYLITTPGGERCLGLCGLANLNWVQRRAEVVLLMGRAQRQRKAAYEPLKRLLRQAFGQWRLEWLNLRLSADDQATLTVCKGFGFVQYGKLEAYLKRQGEETDLLWLGLKAAEFRFVES